MSLVIEAYYLVLPVSAVKRRLVGGVETLRRLSPNQTFACDGEIAGCGFMSFQDVNRFAFELGGYGFTFNLGKPDHELVIVDMNQGLFMPSDWCLFERVPYPGHPGLTLATARLKGGVATEPVGYEGWDPEDSLNLQRQRGELPTIDELEFVERRDGVDVYRHKVTGKLFYSGRTQSNSPEAGSGASEGA